MAINENERIDIQHVTCGLVPLMQTHLESSDIDAVEFQVRQGIHTELWNAFGSGGEWQLKEIRNDLFHDIARFEKTEIDSLDPLGLMDF